MVVLKNVFLKSVKKRKRRARGGSYGGTSGRGHKGYKSRSGSVVKGFEGGQTPIYRRLPRRGMNSLLRKKDAVIVSLKSAVAVAKAKGGIADLISKNGGKNNFIKLIGSDIELSELKHVKKIITNFSSKSVVAFLEKNNVELVLKNN